MRDLAIMVAVAMGEDAAIAASRLDALYPVAPAPKAGDVVGRRSVVYGKAGAGGQAYRRVVDVLADGSERVVSDVAVGPEVSVGVPLL